MQVSSKPLNFIRASVKFSGKGGRRSATVNVKSLLEVWGERCEASDFAFPLKYSLCLLNFQDEKIRTGISRKSEAAGATAPQHVTQYSNLKCLMLLVTLRFKFHCNTLSWLSSAFQYPNALCMQKRCQRLRCRLRT